MRLIQTVPEISAEAAGTTYVVLRLCEELIAKHHDTTLSVIGDQPDYKFVKAFPRGFGPNRLGCSPSMHRWLKREAGSGVVDIVHNHGLWMMPNIYPGWVTKGKSVPYIVSPHGTLTEWAMKSGSSVKKLFWPLIQRPALNNATCFHATAVSEYEDIRRLGFKQPISIIPNGIDLPHYVESGEGMPGSRRTLLFLARIDPKKGIDILLKVWKSLQSDFPDWDLRIVGPDSGAYARYLRGIIKDLNIERVDFAGPLYGEDKLNAYRNADLYVLPTHSENFGMTVAESLASGTPAVVSQGAPWQGLEVKGAGWWPEAGEKPLASALRSAMALPSEHLRSMGQNGRAWMEEEFAWSGVAKNMLDTYQWLLGRSDKPDHVIID